MIDEKQDHKTNNNKYSEDKINSVFNSKNWKEEMNLILNIDNLFCYKYIYYINLIDTIDIFIKFIDKEIVNLKIKYEDIDKENNTKLIEYKNVIL